MSILVAKGRSTVALLIVAIGLCLAPAAPTYAGARVKLSALQAAALETYGPNDGPAFLMISATPDFDLPPIDRVNGALATAAADMGSPVILVNIGTFIAGPDIPSTRFAAYPEVGVELPLDPYTYEPIEIDGNRATIVGSFRTLSPDSRSHLMTPTTQGIPIEVQEAYFTASRMFGEAQRTGALAKFPTTVELAYFIYRNQGGAGARIQDILTHIFYPDTMVSPDPNALRMEVTSGYVEAEGELFPHQPGDGLFGFKFLYDSTNKKLKAEIVLPVSVDIKPGSYPNSVNLGSEGVLPVAILTTATFNAATEIDPATVRAVVFDTYGFEIPGASVPVDKTSISDVNLDGKLDLMVHFRTQELVGVVLSETDVILEVRANTLAHKMLVEGSDRIRVVPPK